MSDGPCEPEYLRQHTKSDSTAFGCAYLTGAKDLVSGPGVEAGMRACCRRGALKLPQRTQRDENHAPKRTMELLLLSLFCSHLLPIMSPSYALI
ncbi:unnamed protein product [Sphagnum balticum]